MLYAFFEFPFHSMRETFFREASSAFGTLVIQTPVENNLYQATADTSVSLELAEHRLLKAKARNSREKENMVLLLSLREMSDETEPCVRSRRRGPLGIVSRNQISLHDQN